MLRRNTIIGDVPFATSYSSPTGVVVTRSGAASTPIKNPSNVPANAVTCDSCLTRQMLLERGYPTTFRAGTGGTDDLGCIIHVATGTRLNPDAYPGPGIAVNVQTPSFTGEAFASRFANFLPIAREFVALTLMYFGPGISTAVGDVVNAIVGEGPSFLPAEAKSLISYVSDVVSQVKAQLQATSGDIDDAIKATFNRYNVSAKTLMDATQPLVVSMSTGFVPSTLTSYLGVRDGLDVVRRIGMGEAPSIATLTTIGACGLHIDSLESALKYRDVQKGMLTMQASIDGAKSQIGTIDPQSIQNFFGRRMLPLENYTADQIRAASWQSGDGFNMAADIAGRYSGKTILWNSAEQTLATLNPASIAQVIPIASARQEFVAKSNEALRMYRAAEASVRSASQTYERSRDSVYAMMRDYKSIPGIVHPGNIEEAQATLRQMLKDAKMRADDTVRAAFSGASALPTYASSVVYPVVTMFPTAVQQHDPFSIMHNQSRDTRGLPYVEQGV